MQYLKTIGSIQFLLHCDFELNIYFSSISSLIVLFKHIISPHIVPVWNIQWMESIWTYNGEKIVNYVHCSANGKSIEFHCIVVNIYPLIFFDRSVIQVIPVQLMVSQRVFLHQTVFLKKLFVYNIFQEWNVGWC